MFLGLVFWAPRPANWFPRVWLRISRWRWGWGLCLPADWRKPGSQAGYRIQRKGRSHTFSPAWWIPAGSRSSSAVCHVNAEQLRLEPAAGFRKGPDFEKRFQKKMLWLPAVLLALLAFVEARLREKVNWGNWQARRVWRKLLTPGIASSSEVGKEFALIPRLKNSVFSKENKKARSRGFALGDDIRAPLSLARCRFFFF